MSDSTDEKAKALDYEANLQRRKEKIAHIFPEYYAAVGWLYANRQIQDQRKRLANRANQMGEGKRVFWGNVLPPAIAAPIKASMVSAVQSNKKTEALTARKLHNALRKTSWYLEVAVPAARGVGMSEASGTLSAAKILDAYASPSRFGTFGQFIRYSRLAPENGKAPKRQAGQRIRYNPKAWQALFDLSEYWNTVTDCYWRHSWDTWKLYYRERFPDEKTHPMGRIHNMARRKVLREFLHDLWDLWQAWEERRKQVNAAD